MLLYTPIRIDVFEIIESTLARFTLTYYAGWQVSSLPFQDQLLLTLMKLRLGCRDMDLGERFGVSRTTVSNVFHTFIFALYELLFEGILSAGIPSQQKCKGSMHKAFDEFVSARIAMDAIEILQDIPSDLDKQSVSYSRYKSRHTLKGVTCVAPNGALVYSSDLYPGSTSDVAIVDHCKVLDELEPGDLILADKGFTIHNLLKQGDHLNIPPFLSSKTHFTKEEAQMCLKIARARIHIERANERLKNFFLRHVSTSYRSISTEIFQVCCCLINFQAPLLKEIADNYSMQ